MTALHWLAGLVLLPCLPALLGYGGAGWYGLQAAAVAVYALVAGLPGFDTTLLATVPVLAAKPAVLLWRGGVAWSGPPPARPVALAAGLVLVLVALTSAHTLGSVLAEDAGMALSALLLGMALAVTAPLPGLLMAENGAALALVLVPDLAFRPAVMLASAGLVVLMLGTGRILVRR